MMHPLVTICCTTFNQENYIEQTLEGFYIQQTNFNFEILIHDDASTDHTQSILKKHAEKDTRIRLILQTENKYSKNVMPWWHYSFPQSRGTYIALCEGDDYWTDPLKLQKQIDFLETHPNYVIAWTDYIIFDGSAFRDNDFNHTSFITPIDYNNIFSPYCTLTLTAVFRKDAADLSFLKSLKHSKDNSLYLMLLSKGKGVFMNFTSAVYRVHEAGVYSMQSQFFKSYSSYLNLKELIETIPESNTRNIKKVLRSLGKGAAFSALKSRQIGEKLTDEQQRFMDGFFKNASIGIKFKYYKRLLKYFFKKDI